MTERLDRIQQLVETIRHKSEEVQALDAAAAAKRGELARLEAELSALAVRKSPPRPAEGRAKNGERRDQILALAREGLDRVQIRQATGLPPHVVNAALRRLRETGRLPDPRQLALEQQKKHVS
ncbi:MAG: hypothetical protein ACJ8GN_02015 [Longimicrobiaceae bacterium]